ncbi:C40 family peptidase [Lentzea sp. NBRC 102530]|uniref:C40 family peptidase n=1 Tax=Lentzea sp. NBRC 102530 TaxID=3032201 RepID=UPI0024A1674A|nr:C40 family peptidase [Lentzea sp. NBRC 102530]GLY54839.1 lipoprotein [Lentzea sp. NBRC 102530]
MRPLTLTVLGAGTAVTAMVAVMVLSPSAVPWPRANASEICQSAVGPWTGGSQDQGRNDAARLNEEQRGIVTAIIGIGKQRQVPALGWQVAIQAGMTESGLRNLDHGDLDSVGIFQMRTSMGWGTPEQLQDVDYQINKFFDVLLAIPDWTTMRPGDAAQRVERSAYPDRYHRWEPMAVFLVGELGGVVDPSGCGGAGGLPGPNSEAAAKAIAFAREQIGDMYLWGGNGPDRWDCSGLLVAAYREAGILLPRVADQQYHAGKHVPVGQAEPGDLVFWSADPNDPRGIHHVAMYLGAGQVIQAPYDGQPVQISAIDDPKLVKASELVPMATRPGT